MRVYGSGHATSPYPPPSTWRQRHQTANRLTKAEKDAAMAALLAKRDGESEAESEVASHATLLGAARHSQRLSKDVSFCAEAHAALLSKSKDLFQQAMAAKPLAQQVQELQKALDAKVEQSVAHGHQIEAMQAKMKQIDREGLELEQQLNAAMTKLTAESSGPTHPKSAFSSAALSHTEAIGQVEQLSGMLPPEASQPFSQCLMMLRDFIQSANMQQTGAPTYAKAASGGVPAMAPSGPEIPVVDLVNGGGVQPMAARQPQAADAQSTTTIGQQGGLFQVGGGQASGGAAGGSNALLSARRGRARLREPSVDSMQEDFLPVGGRSRSAPAHRRILGKTSRASVEKKNADAIDSAKNKFLENGSRYFPTGWRGQASIHDIQHFQSTCRWSCQRV